MVDQNVTSSGLGRFEPAEAFFGLRTMFYACTPNETSYENVEDVPRFVDKASTYFFLLITLEFIVLNVQGQKKRLPRWNDSFSSLSAGMISQVPLLVFRNIEVAAYIYVYNNWNIYSLPWDSPWTWWLSMLGVDLGYYWVHRCAHEINFMWAGHQTHHSSQEYNLTTALRQGFFQRYSSWIFYLPLALFIRPSMFVVHIQLNLLYQFWIHTETVSTLGPLEYILNTPSHHRVHHGVNRYCIDKNYAGVLIIWDRMFGTFEPERKDDEVVYGLTHQLNSWNPLYTQTSHWLHILSTAWNANGISNKLSYLVKGPGWEPGKSRLGDIESIPDVHAPATKFNKHVKGFWNIYCITQFVLTLVLYESLVKYKQNLSVNELTACVLFILWTLTDIGFLYENQPRAKWLEFGRCAAYLIADFLFISQAASTTVFVVKVMRVVLPVSLLLSVGQIVAAQSSPTKKID